MDHSIIRVIILCCFFILLCIFYIYMYIKYQKHIDAEYDTIFKTVHIKYIYKINAFHPIIGEKVSKYNFKEEGEAAYNDLKCFLFNKSSHVRRIDEYGGDNYKEASFKDINGIIIAFIKLERELYDKDVIITYRRREDESRDHFLDRTMEHAKNASTT